MAPSRAYQATLKRLQHLTRLNTPPGASSRACLSAARLHSTATTSSTPSSASHSSLNPSEVSHFNALASSWWDPHGPSRLLHLMNPLRHDFIASCHASQPDALPPSPPSNPTTTYLDIGCGGGIFAESAARLPGTNSVTGLDPTPDVLSIARAHASRDPALQPPRLQYVSGTVESLPLPQSPPEQYDVVSCFEVVEHVDRPADFLDRCGEFVKPGGWMVLSTIARTWMSWLTTNVVAEDLLRIVPRGTHDWNKYINEDELRGHFAKRSGWNSPRVMGVLYAPGVGWKTVPGSEKVGNYFFGIRKDSSM